LLTSSRDHSPSQGCTSGAGTPATPTTPASTHTILVVDENTAERMRAGRLLEASGPYRVLYANNGADALAMIAGNAPAVVLTDLQISEMDSVDLVDEIRGKHPLVPVILMMGPGHEGLALQALRQGAASFIAKENLSDELGSTLEQVLAAARLDRRQQRLLGFVTSFDACFELENDPALVPVLVAHLQQHLARLSLCDENERVRIGVALEEALVNALYHGNLELSSSLRQDDSDTYERLAEERRKQPPHCTRRLFVRTRMSRDEAVFVIRDEGPGFDPAAIPDPTDPANLDRVGGRGLLLIRTFMDDVSHNAAGNEITLVKRRRAGG
jgi:CheY-like chemotaxis protein